MSVKKSNYQLISGVTLETRKDKLGTPASLKSLGETILHSISPKLFKRTPKLKVQPVEKEISESEYTEEEEIEIEEDKNAEEQPLAEDNK